ncbi:MAG TPA: class I mannose-6-phosphate isomerase [Allosphingosinicella sp.]|jgi:mannose-6-phosphate isomerase
MKLKARAVEKPWGRYALPAAFGSRRHKAPVGEIWFEPPNGRALPLLVKYLFTGEKLSVQVHPDDEHAQARGHGNGKSECWYIVDAEPGAVVGLGFREALDAETLRAAALDGSIEHLLDWKPAKAGDFFHVPPGTVHAIGAGISLIEVQQHSDVTYRLYDYGRDRELHLEDALAVASPLPYPEDQAARVQRGRCRTLVACPHFQLEYIGHGGPVERIRDRERWVLPLRGTVSFDGMTGKPGDCLLVPAGAALEVSDGGAILMAASADRAVLRAAA